MKKDKLPVHDDPKQRRIHVPFNACGQSWNGGFRPFTPSPGYSCHGGIVTKWQKYSGSWERFASECECMKTWRYGREAAQVTGSRA